MIEIPEEILTKLKCCVCQDYITCPPIFIKKDGQNICEKCKTVTNLKKNVIRNQLFEEIAVLLMFPCNFAKHGCSSKLKWGETQEHEKDCKHGKINLISCAGLSAEECSWQGAQHDVLAHFKKDHPALVVKHPYKISSYDNWIVNDMKKLKKVSFRNMVMEAFGFLFVIQFKICFQSDFMWISVSLVGEAKLSAHFEYFVEHYENNLILNRNCLKVMQVLSKLSTLNEKNSIKMTLNKNMNIFINRNSVKCENCHTIYSEILNDQVKFCCDDWSFVRNEKTKLKRTAQRCLFYDEGCTYLDISKNLEKHRLYLCKFSPKFTKCTLCDTPINKESIYDHQKTKHFVTLIPNNLPNIRAKLFDVSHKFMENEYGVFLWSWGTLLHENVMRLPFGQISGRNILFFLEARSNLPSDEDEKLSIKIVFINKVTGTEFKNVLDYDKNDSTWNAVFKIEPWSIRSNHLIYSLRFEIDKTN